MRLYNIPTYFRSTLWHLLSVAVISSMIIVPSAFADLVTDQADVKVTNDNNNVDGGTPNPGFDAQNRQSNETSVAISPANRNTVAVGANDYRMGSVFGDGWLGFYISADGGATWFNTMVPGFPSDTSIAGLASPLLGLDVSGDPVVRFDADGHLYVAGVAFNRDFDQRDRPVDNVIYVARYDYTPGTPGGVSTPNAAVNPPNFTYAGTTVVDRGAAAFAVPGAVGKNTGSFVDKEWMEIDLNPPSASRCAGNVYVAYTDFHGKAGSQPIKFNRSTDGGVTFVQSKAVSTGGKAGTPFNQGSDIAVASNGTIYIAYSAIESSTLMSSINLVKSTDCGKHWSQPVQVGSVTFPPAPVVAFRTPGFAFVATDSTDPDIVYVAYQNFLDGDYDVYVQRSTDGGLTWGTPVQVNGDSSAARHQIFPTISVSHSALHVAWYDFRNSVTADNEALDVYYACTNCGSYTYPEFSPSERVTDVSHNGNCRMFGGGTSAFHGDYNELAAYFDGANHIVHVSWADNRDVSQCDLDPTPGPDSNNTGNRNQNIYADKLVVTP